MSLDFTLTKYGELCQAIVASGYPVWTIARYLSGEKPPGLVVLLRHDIDRRPGSALKMARLECDFGLRATYYARMTPCAFKPSILKEIASMGHEVGYHYETLSKAKGDTKEAIDLFKKELACLREVCEIETISMHGSPLSPYDNRWLWRDCDFHEFGLLGEAYLSIDYSKLLYLTDTGRSWGDTCYNLRDTIGQRHHQQCIRSTDDLIALIQEGKAPHICISAHPERWAKGIGGWAISLVRDWCINQAKLFIGLYRGLKGSEWK